MRRKHIIWGVGTVLVAWYAGNFCLRFLFFPTSYVGALAYAEQARLRHLASENPTQEEIKQALPTLQISGWQDNSYSARVAIQPDGQWELVAEPKWRELYRHPLWKRILFLDFRRIVFPVWRVRSGDPNVVPL
jgi:hypothetical protein